MVCDRTPAIFAFPGRYDEPTTALMDDSKHASKRIKLNQRLGTYSISILIGGTLLILGCIAFLGFLWLGDENNTAWRSIVVSGWVTRSITIMAFVLRAVTAAQAAVATSMVAALLLQSAQTKLASAAAVSIARFANIGPIALVEHLHKRVAWPISLLVGTLVAVSVALQLTSTLLLSGVGRGAIETTQTFPDLSYGITSRSIFSIPRETVGYLLHSKLPTGFPAFAEYAEPAPAGAADGVRDTGPSKRAFLPIPAQAQREATLSYEGMATVLDTRVVCMRPKIEGLRIFPPTTKGHFINGTISTDEKVLGQVTPGGAPPTKFSCGYAVINKETRFSVDGTDTNAFNDWDEEWPISLCNLDMLQDSNIRSELRSPLLPEMLYPYLPVKLIIHSTGPYSAWNMTGGLNVTKMSSSGEWLVAETSAGTSLRMTLCASDVISQDTHITAVRPAAVPEPVPIWRSDKAVYNVDPILTQLGVSPAPAVSRGIYAASLPSPLLRTLNTTTDDTGMAIPAREETFPQHTFVLQALVDLSYYAGTLDDNPLQTHKLAMCVYCTTQNYGINLGSQLAAVPAAVFQGAMRATGGNAALAMQALMTTALGMTYYDLTGRFDKASPAEIRGMVEVDRPMNGAFAIVVVVLLVVHLLLVGAATACFAISTEDSLLGGAWAAVAQVRGRDVDGWLEEAGRVRDGEVKRRMEAAGEGGVLVGVDSGSADGRLRLRQRGGIKGEMDEG